MRKLTSEDPETKSTDLTVENIGQLKALFPEAFTEGKVDFEVLKQLLGGAVEDREEKYGLNWHGKRRARQLALTPSTGTLRPCPEESVDWDSTQNLMIEGDNLEVLKLLQKSYSGKVKLIYIDPPYNTGKDFVYPDNFQDNIKNYLELTGQVEGGRKISSNTEAGGRFHTDWLNMIYPRLKLARNLLRDDGIIVVSIDDNEVLGMLAILNEIFGEENALANIVWQRRDTPANDVQGFSTLHEYLLCFAKNVAGISLGLIERTDEQLSVYANPDNDPRGRWTRTALTRPGESSKDCYPITSPTGRKAYPPKGTSWRVSKDTLQRLISENRLWWGTKGTGDMPFQKRFLTEVKQGIVPTTWWDYKFAGSMRNAKSESRDLFQNDPPFDYPKPVSLLERVLNICASTEGDDLVLDFFAGSGTTAHAVFSTTKSAKCKRRVILVQLPEDTGRKDYPTIADITKERLRRAGKRVREENPMFAGDTGFRVFKLDSSNIRAWEPDRANLTETLEEYVEHIKSDRTEADILFELLLKLGLDLAVPIEQRSIAGKTVHSVGAGALLACLAEAITDADAEPLALGMVAWHRELSPPDGAGMVFRDGAFSDDVAKTNLTAILHQHGIQNVRSL